MQLLWQQETATASDIVQWVTAKKAVSMRTVKTLLRRLVAKKAVGVHDWRDKSPHLSLSRFGHQRKLHRRKGRCIHENGG